VLQTIYTGDWFSAELALLGEQLSEAGQTVGFVVVRSKLVVGEYFGALSATETLAMPRRLLVGHSALRYRLHTNR